MSFRQAVEKKLQETVERVQDAVAELPHPRDLLPMREFERQQPIINELVTRFERLQNKRESYRVAVARPTLPAPPLLTTKTASSSSSSSSLTSPQHSPEKAAGRPAKTRQHGTEKAAGPDAGVAKKPTQRLVTMDSVLLDKKLREHFREFIETAYAVENLDFFEAVESFEILINVKDRQAAARKLVDTFVRPNAPNQVNLPSSLATRLANAVDAGNAEESSKLFLQAKQEICFLMQTNFLDKFLSVVGQPAYVPLEDCEEEKDEEDEAAQKKREKAEKWVRRAHHKTGDVYFENVETGVTMWEMPKSTSPKADQSEATKRKHATKSEVPPPIDKPPYF